MEAKMDVEHLLQDGKTVQLKVNGYSMYPLFVPERDMAVIGPPRGRLKRGDVVLFRRDEGILVLHRIWKIKKNGLFLVGDNQTQVEGPVRFDQVRGMLTGFVRRGRTRSVRHLAYRAYSTAWLLMRPFRHRIAVAVHAVKQRFSRKTD